MGSTAAHSASYRHLSHSLDWIFPRKHRAKVDSARVVLWSKDDVLPVASHDTEYLLLGCVEGGESVFVSLSASLHEIVKEKRGNVPGFRLGEAFQASASPGNHRRNGEPETGCWAEYREPGALQRFPSAGFCSCWTDRVHGWCGGCCVHRCVASSRLECQFHGTVVVARRERGLVAVEWLWCAIG